MIDLTDDDLDVVELGDDGSRVINRLLAEICQERGIPCQEFCDGWLVRAGGGDKSFHVIGFTFPLNSATASRIAEDKAATYECLRASAVPAVEHRLVLSPALRGWVSEAWSASSALQAIFAALGGDVVIKENGGSGGGNVVRVRTVRELESAAIRMFSRFHAVAVSPFVHIWNELRVYVAPVRGTVDAVMIYSKARAVVKGDGASSVRVLQAKAPGRIPRRGAIIAATGQPIGPDDVPEPGANIVLHWKHNLGRGASPEVHDVHRALGITVQTVPHPATQEVRDLALNAARAIGLRFGAVDVVSAHDADASTYRILEINGGVMLESFARLSDDHRRVAKAIYSLALDEAFR
jgi:glutathione synthase/RimK-type ligase-like ATP-grasp enzyme